VRGVEIISEELSGNLFAAADIDGSQSLDFDEVGLRAEPCVRKCIPSFLF
jgi:hypothetical protein